MRYVSLFDGGACGLQALKNLQADVEQYNASEVDKNAMAVANANHPEINQLGRVELINGRELGSVDFLMGGSPCQGFSFSGEGKAFEDERSKLFFEFVRILDECKPSKFLLENVPMLKKNRAVISSYLGVEPVLVNSSSFSGQNRERLYWANFPIKPGEGPGPSFLEELGVERLYSAAVRGRYISKEPKVTAQRLEVNGRPKINCLTTVAKDTVLAYHPPGTRLWRPHLGFDYRLLTSQERCKLHILKDVV